MSYARNLYIIVHGKCDIKYEDTSVKIRDR